MRDEDLESLVVILREHQDRAKSKHARYVEAGASQAAAYQDGIYQGLYLALRDLEAAWRASARV